MNSTAKKKSKLERLVHAAARSSCRHRLRPGRPATSPRLALSLPINMTPGGQLRKSNVVGILRKNMTSQKLKTCSPLSGGIKNYPRLAAGRQLSPAEVC